MPPKKVDQPKKKVKSVDDKTFGMKNENAELFKPVQVQKVPFGVDPKTVLCQFHKKGGCEKGRKCKFSHDLNIERKAAKKDLYTDSREAEEDTKKADTMDTWDEEKLRTVVMSKHGNPRTTTDKVCKFFIEAVENQKYGWFWICPNGGDKCMYKHSLPPGFVLKTKEQRAAEKALMDKSPLNTLTLEDWLESERHKLTGTLTPVNPETFAKWKKERLDKKAAEAEAQKAKEATGRSMFESGDWKNQESSDEESDGDDDEDDDGFNLDALRLETERLRAQKEEERLAKLHGVQLPPSNDEALVQEAAG
ncbi:Translation machinery-associated protein 46 [Penicillium herquei]|nr:Translation machinery-associated protein 46 [Penicillium herquei]